MCFPIKWPSTSFGPESQLMAFPLSAAALIGILVQSALYGLYLVLFVGSFYTTHKKRLRGGLRNINIFLFAVTIVLFLLITAHWVLQVLEVVDAFIYKVDKNPDTYYQDRGNPKYVAKATFHVSQTIVADSTMVSRPFYLHSKTRPVITGISALHRMGENWRVVLLPLALSLGLIGSGIAFINSFARTPLGQVGSGVGGFISVISFFGQRLISYRIWIINRSAVGYTSQHKTHSIIYILLENVMLYLACLSSTLVGFIFGEAYELIPLDATGPVIGIAFCLILIWVGLGMGIESTSQAPSDLKFYHSSEITTRNAHNTPRSCDSGDFPGSTLEHPRRNTFLRNAHKSGVSTS
ncbi:hypothetical protein BD779DRAFT_1522667 [Infundibulicybe gibba]|nr:hypothetical protein BD779DRAFT_1522667 [Infundibulicybe gibba]